VVLAGGDEAQVAAAVVEGVVVDVVHDLAGLGVEDQPVQQGAAGAGCAVGVADHVAVVLRGPAVAFDEVAVVVVDLGVGDGVALAVVERDEHDFLLFRLGSYLLRTLVRIGSGEVMNGNTGT